MPADGAAQRSAATRRCEATVAASPQDTDARDALARSCARAGKHAEALAQYDALLARNAANPDWLLGKSQALMALGRPREALPLLEGARRDAPDYEDLWRANANALDQLDQFDAADALLAQAAAQFPQSTWPRERQAALRERRLLERGTRLSADVSYEELSGNRSAWKGASLGVNSRLGENRHGFAGLHLEERFDTRDEQLQLGYSARLGDAWSYGISGDFAPDAEVLPEWSVAADAGRALPDDWGIGFRLRHASYQSSDVDTFSTLLDKYIDAWSYRLLAQRREDLRHRRPELRAPAASRARVRGLRAAPRSSSASARRRKPSRPASCR